MSNLNLSCCRARVLSHSQVHRKQQLTIRNNSTNQAPSHDSLLVITDKQFIFLFLSRSSSQTHNHTIKTHTLFLSIFQVVPPHVEVAIRTPMTCVCVIGTWVQSHSLHASQLPSLTGDDRGEDNNDCLGAVGMMSGGDMVKY